MAPRKNGQTRQQPPSRTRVYVDGFNLFYGSLKDRGLLWLNLGLLADRLAGGPVDAVLYCTSMMRGGDFDLVEPIRLMVKEEGREVVVVNPQRERSEALQRVASTYLQLDAALLHRSLLPDRVELASGRVVTRPELWRRGGERPSGAKRTRDDAREACCAAGGGIDVRKFLP